LFCLCFQIFDHPAPFDFFGCFSRRSLVCFRCGCTVSIQRRLVRNGAASIGIDASGQCFVVSGCFS